MHIIALLLSLLFCPCDITCDAMVNSPTFEVIVDLDEFILNQANASIPLSTNGGGATRKTNLGLGNVAPGVGFAMLAMSGNSMLMAIGSMLALPSKYKAMLIMTKSCMDPTGRRETTCVVKLLMKNDPKIIQATHTIFSNLGFSQLLPNGNKSGKLNDDGIVLVWSSPSFADWLGINNQKLADFKVYGDLDLLPTADEFLEKKLFLEPQGKREGYSLMTMSLGDTIANVGLIMKNEAKVLKRYQHLNGTPAMDLNGCNLEIIEGNNKDGEASGTHPDAPKNGCIILQVRLITPQGMFKGQVAFTHGDEMTIVTQAGNIKRGIYQDVDKLESSIGFAMPIKGDVEDQLKRKTYRSTIKIGWQQLSLVTPGSWAKNLEWFKRAIKATVNRDKFRYNTTLFRGLFLPSSEEDEINPNKGSLMLAFHKATRWLHLAKVPLTALVHCTALLRPLISRYAEPSIDGFDPETGEYEDRAAGRALQRTDIEVAGYSGYLIGIQTVIEACPVIAEVICRAIADRFNCDNVTYVADGSYFQLRYPGGYKREIHIVHSSAVIKWMIENDEDLILPGGFTFVSESARLIHGNGATPDMSDVPNANIDGTESDTDGDQVHDVLTEGRCAAWTDVGGGKLRLKDDRKNPVESHRHPVESTCRFDRRIVFSYFKPVSELDEEGNVIGSMDPMPVLEYSEKERLPIPDGFENEYDGEKWSLEHSKNAIKLRRNKVSLGMLMLLNGAARWGFSALNKTVKMLPNEATIDGIEQELYGQAFFDWIDQVQKKYANVLEKLDVWSRELCQRYNIEQDAVRSFNREHPFTVLNVLKSQEAIKARAWLMDKWTDPKNVAGLRFLAFAEMLDIKNVRTMWSILDQMIFSKSEYQAAINAINEDSMAWQQVKQLIARILCNTVHVKMLTKLAENEKQVRSLQVLAWYIVLNKVCKDTLEKAPGAVYSNIYRIFNDLYTPVPVNENGVVQKMFNFGSDGILSEHYDVCERLADGCRTNISLEMETDIDWEALKKTFVAAAAEVKGFNIDLDVDDATEADITQLLTSLEEAENLDEFDVSDWE